jgi:hypothetical protein
MTVLTKANLNCKLHHQHNYRSKYITFIKSHFFLSILIDINYEPILCSSSRVCFFLLGVISDLLYSRLNEIDKSSNISRR